MAIIKLEIPIIKVNKKKSFIYSYRTHQADRGTEGRQCRNNAALPEHYNVCIWATDKTKTIETYPISLLIFHVFCLPIKELYYIT